MNEQMTALLNTAIPQLDGCTVFAVGGAVRDALDQVASHDLDFAVECSAGWAGMRQAILDAGCEIFVETPEFLTIRAKGPDKSMPTLDFVLCRSDGPTADGRRPEFVTPGTISDDLARRDFTVNAIALNMRTGEILDPFDGREDLADRLIRFVGDPSERINEDGLRVLRGFRFSVTKNMDFEWFTKVALRSRRAATMLQSVHVERVREELDKMFRADTPAAMRAICGLPADIQAAIFRDGLRFFPTLKS